MRLDQEAMKAMLAPYVRELEVQHAADVRARRRELKEAIDAANAAFDRAIGPLRKKLTASKVTFQEAKAAHERAQQAHRSDFHAIAHAEGTRDRAVAAAEAELRELAAPEIGAFDEQMDRLLIATRRMLVSEPIILRGHYIGTETNRPSVVRRLHAILGAQRTARELPHQGDIDIAGELAKLGADLPPVASETVRA